MLIELAQIFVEAARVLVLVLDAGRADPVGTDEVRYPLLTDRLRIGARILLELRVRRRVRAVAAAGEGEGKRALRVAQTEVQRRVGSHRKPDDVRARDLQAVEHAADVVAGPLLRVAVGVLGNVGGRIATSVVCNAAVQAREVPHLRLPAAVIAAEFVHENDGRAGTGFLVMQSDAVIRFDLGHVAFYGDESRSLQAVRPSGIAGARRAGVAHASCRRGGDLGEGG